METVRGTLAGRYELAEVIGRGGMGTVYRARDLLLGRSVAVKVLSGSLAEDDPTSVMRFEREARAAAALNHPGVVAVYDTGADDGARFIVMELVEGRSLETILRDQGPLDPGRARRIVARVADALAAAHAAGIVHRDIKPANVMVADDESVKVLDFGIARAHGASTLTAVASVLGTAAYMAPELASGGQADARSDIYSLGCLLYALLTGGAPFRGDGIAAIINQHATTPPPSPRELNPRVSGALAALTLAMLAKAPEDRPQSAIEVRDRLTGAAGPTAPTAPTAVLPIDTAVTEPLRRVVPSRARRLAPAALAAAVILGTAIVALTSDGSPRRLASASHGSSTHAPKKPSAKSHTPATTATTTPPATTAAPATTTSPRTQTVSQAAASLGALIAAELQSGAIDQQAAQQLIHGLADITSSYQNGNSTDAANKLTALSQQITTLAQHGDVSAAAAPALQRAVAALGSALGAGTAANPGSVTGAGPGGGGKGGNGHGGGPPGKAKKGGGGDGGGGGGGD